MTNPAKHRILVVDDELTVCKSIRQVLVREDCEVDMADALENHGLSDACFRWQRRQV